MQTPPPDASPFLTKYTWLGYLIAALVAWLSKDPLSTYLDRVFGRRKVSAEADGQTIQNVKSAGEWAQEIFHKLTLMEMNAIKLNRQIEELKVTCKENDELIRELLRSAKSKDIWIGVLEGALREGEVRMPRRPPSS